MGSKTTNFNLNKHDLNDTVEVVTSGLATNFETIDSTLKAIKDQGETNKSDIATNKTNLETTDTNLNKLVNAQRYRKRKGLYYVSDILTGSISSAVSMIGNNLRAIPFIVAEPTTFDRIGVYSSTSSAGNYLRFGIYNSNENLEPTTLVLDSGEFSAASSGYKESIINVTLQPGIYFLVLLQSVTMSIRGVSNTGGSPLLGIVDPINDATVRSAYDVAFTYAPLPSTYPSGFTATAVSVPNIYMRVAP